MFDVCVNIRACVISERLQEVRDWIFQFSAKKTMRKQVSKLFKDRPLVSGLILYIVNLVMKEYKRSSKCMLLQYKQEEKVKSLRCREVPVWSLRMFY